MGRSSPARRHAFATLGSPNPNIEIEFLSIPDFADYYDKLIQLHAAGTPIDVQRHNVQRLGQVTAKGMLVDLASYYERDGIDITDPLTGIMPAISRDGGAKIYAIPQDENLHGLFYNLDLFDDAWYAALRRSPCR